MELYIYLEPEKIFFGGVGLWIVIYICLECAVGWDVTWRLGLDGCWDVEVVGLASAVLEECLRLASERQCGGGEDWTLIVRIGAQAGYNSFAGRMGFWFVGWG